MEAGAALGDALLQMARQDGGPGVWEQAREAAEWVLSKEPENAEARGVRANVRFWRDWNWAGAEQDFLYALKLNPSAAETWRDFAWFQMAMGRTREALEALRWAIELDPLSAPGRVDAGWLYAQARRYDDAAREARQALLIEPGSKQAWECLSEALAETGDARGAARAMLAYLPAGETAGLRGVPAGRAIREWRQRQAVRLGDPWSRAKRLAGLGQRDAALAALGEAVQTRVPSVVMIGSEPAFARYQADPEFRRLLVKLRLP
jgi:tetratricopeptide (TPR) repeat protein